DFNGFTTTYGYDTGSNPVTQNALTSITNPDGTHEFFQFDAQGRLSGTHRDGGAEDVAYTFGPIGAVTAADGTGGATTYSFDELGLIAKVEDPLGRVTRFSFDRDTNLTQTTDSAGQRYNYLYDPDGNLIRATDPLGHSVSFGYAGPF